ncbi:hypothetical protein HDU91_006549 [Kappamyces sp. JEL0680]|nr:hypothetical protein HDU91_006549 [Kappamyces sp. JEL0680]
MPSFLHDLCDFHLCYAGCSNIDSMLLVNFVFVWFWIAVLAMAAVFPLERIYTHIRLQKPLNRLFSINMCCASICFLMAVCRLTSLLVARNIASHKVSDEQLQEIVRLNILLEWPYYVLGASSMFQYSGWVLQSFSGSIYKERISKTIEWFHAVLLVMLTVLVSLFAFDGTSHTLDEYIFWRRAMYLSIASIHVLVEPALLYFSGTISITLLLQQEGNGDNQESKITAIKKKIVRLKKNLYALIGSYIFVGLSIVSLVVVNDLYAKDGSVLLAEKVVYYLTSSTGVVTSTYLYFIPTVLKLLGKKGRSLNGNSQKGPTSLKPKSASKQMQIGDLSSQPTIILKKETTSLP